MPPAPPPALPPDMMGRIARAALTAEGDDVQAWARLSLVSRTWRDGLHGTSSGLGLGSGLIQGINQLCCKVPSVWKW